MAFTFTVLHEDQDLPHAIRHHVDGGIQIINNVFMTRQLFLHHGMKKKELVSASKSRWAHYI